MMRKVTMKTNILKLTGTLTGALLLTLLTACGPSNPPPTEPQPVTTPPAPAVAAAPAAPAAPPAATPAAPPETPSAAPATPAAATPATAAPAGMVTYVPLPTGNTMKIDGTSTVHDWSMKSSIISGSVEADANFPESALTDAKAARPAVNVSVPVKSLKSGTTKMDTLTYEYLKQPEFKNIEYRLIELKPKSAAGTTGALKFDAVGALTIMGITLTNNMLVTIEKADGKLKIVGTTAVKCTDYKLKPYRYLVLTCGDDLKLSFDWLLAPKAP